MTPWTNAGAQWDARSSGAERERVQLEPVEERLADTGATWTAFYVASGVSEPTISGIRKGRPVKRRDKLRGISRALGWSPDSIDRMLRGEDPIVVTSAAVITERPQLALERLAKLSAQGAAKARSRSRASSHLEVPTSRLRDRPR